MSDEGKPARQGRRQRSDGARTHEAILEAATQLASVEGIHGLTLGRLAETLGVSKSGLYAHFGSKERLQLETIGAAAKILETEVVQPMYQAAPGISRLETLVSAYFSYLERDVFAGGCFFAALLADADARTGPIHDVVVSIERDWLQELAGLFREAQERAEIVQNVDVAQLAFELHACFELTNYHYVLFRDPAVLERGRTAAIGILTRARGATS